MSVHDPVKLERDWAAELARSARRAMRRDDLAHASELLDWALLIVPNSATIERLRIVLLLKERHVDAASAMIARRLLEKPNDAGLLLLQARCLSLQGELKSADEILCRVRAAAPERRDALEVSAEVASRIGDHRRALELSARLYARHSNDERALAVFCNALIEVGDAEHARHAERLLCGHGNPPAGLLARSLLIQGRHREAVDCLESFVNTAHCDGADEAVDSLLALYLEALESCGDVNRIESLLGSADAHTRPMAALAFARIMLAQGRFRTAAALAMNVVRTSNAANREAALPIATVAGTLAGRKRLARHAMSQRTTVPTPSHGVALAQTWADCWRRGLRGRLLHEQRSPCGASSRGGGGDPSPSVLRSLLHNAVSVFEKRLLAEHDAGHDGPSQTEHDMATCRAALGAK